MVGDSSAGSRCALATSSCSAAGTRCTGSAGWKAVWTAIRRSSPTASSLAWWARWPAPVSCSAGCCPNISRPRIGPDGATGCWTDMDYDDTGKVSFDHIYDELDPRAYFNTLRRLDYCIPQLARRYFMRLLIRRVSSHGGPATMLDIGCSYGINAALLRCG